MCMSSIGTESAGSFPIFARPDAKTKSNCAAGEFQQRLGAFDLVWASLVRPRLSGCDNICYGLEDIQGCFDHIGGAFKKIRRFGHSVGSFGQH